jgi:RimJ/RimL family protein N-acetyltransferase
VVNRDTAHQEPWTLAIEKQQSGPAMTGILGETMLGCAGIILPWPGMGLAWMVLSEQIGEHGLWMTKMVKRFLDDAIRCYGLHRLEAVVLSDNECNQKWIERLGFTRENGCARAYTQDRRDVIRYEWVRG